MLKCLRKIDRSEPHYSQDMFAPPLSCVLSLVEAFSIILYSSHDWRAPGYKMRETKGKIVWRFGETLAQAQNKYGYGGGAHCFKLPNLTCRMFSCRRPNNLGSKDSCVQNYFLNQWKSPGFTKSLVFAPNFHRPCFLLKSWFAPSGAHIVGAAVPHFDVNSFNVHSYEM